MYTGLCIGGPRDGQILQSAGAEYAIEIQARSDEDDPFVEVAAKDGNNTQTFRYHHFTGIRTPGDEQPDIDFWVPQSEINGDVLTYVFTRIIDRYMGI